MTLIEKLKFAEKDYTITDFACPVCKRKMFTEAHSGGVYVWCGLPNIPRADGAHCNEVTGHGKDSKAAYQIIVEKFTKALAKD